jgi:hypothetical protein
VWGWWRGVGGVLGATGPFKNRKRQNFFEDAYQRSLEKTKTNLNNGKTVE